MAALANRYALPKSNVIEVEVAGKTDAGGEVKSAVGSDSAVGVGAGAAAVAAAELASAAAAEGDEVTGHFTFSPAGASGVKPFPPSKEMSKLFEKWGLKAHCVYREYRYDEPLQSEDQVGTFLADFFSDRTVQSELQISTSGNTLVGCPNGVAISEVNYAKLSTKTLSMKFFDKMQSEARLVTDSGYIRKCLDEVIEGVTCTDLLCQMFISEESEHIDLYSDEEKAEFIFHLLRRLVVGGSLSQSEDTWGAYLDTCKALYKHFVSVGKNSVTKKLQVLSDVYEIKSTKGGFDIFPDENMHNFAYVVIDKARRTVKYWCTAFVSWW